MSSPWRLRGHLDGREHTFEPRLGELRVGSSPRSDLRLPGLGVSREHAILTVTQKGMAVLDCGSKNGTFVDGRRVDRAALRQGSVVGFGPVELVVEGLDEEDLELAIALDSEESVSWQSFESMSQETAHCDPAAPALELVVPDSHLPGTSPAMVGLYRSLEMVARGAQPVLIMGETGVGKEGLVSIIHGSSRRRQGPLITLNCAAIPTELFEAELFGVGKGVATGVEPRPGKVKAADGGTLFLDEIGDMPLPLQTKLLRVLQENEIQPLGGRVETVDIRVVAATNARLEQQMRQGAFRRDLYYRLAGTVVDVPPLRHRKSDIPALVEHFLRRFAQEAGIRLRGVTVKAMEHWLGHDWPGNVRELEHEVRRAVSKTADFGIIDTHKVLTAVPEEPQTEKDLGGEQDLHLESRLQALETELIQEALRRTQGRQNHAAKLLGVSRNGLARRLDRLGIDYRDFR